MCESINHWAPNCPDKTESQNDMWLSYEAILFFQAGFDHSSKLRDLPSESWNAAVFDSGTNKTVCGQIVTSTPYLRARNKHRVSDQL